jgi:hypothetical protein
MTATNHPWSSDPVAQAAVRAAEDDAANWRRLEVGTEIISALTADKDAAIRERDAALARVAELESQAKLAPAPNVGGGSNQADAEPVAFAVKHGGEFVHTTTDEDEARQYQGAVVPLFRAPLPPRGWLTDEEREAVRVSAALNPRMHDGKTAAALNALLARNSPPRVRRVAPWKSKDARSEPFTEELLARRDLEWIAAIAKAGVEVSE